MARDIVLHLVGLPAGCDEPSRATLRVEPDIMCGEFVRNAAVNLGIVPDTAGGVTSNVRVFRAPPLGAAVTEAQARAGVRLGETIYEPWPHQPEDSLAEAGLADEGEILVVELEVDVTETPA
mmetsp:Transcript_17187/g.52775  ORF Transcript_17187/g.52775 Transcript_17187/m.52775 type:complete len:122 (-) Transcript_17187:133-498(-)